MFSKLNIYLAKNFLVSFLIIFIVFAALLIIGDFVEQFRKSTGKNVPLSIIFQLSILNFFSLINFIIPIVAYFGSLLAFLNLIKNSELIVINTIGISSSKIMLPAVILYFLIGIFFVTIVNPLSVVFYNKYTELEYKYINKSDKFASITKNGLWLKQFNQINGFSSVLYAQQISDNGKTLFDFMLLEYDSDGTYQGRVDGKKAILNNNYWNMTEVQVTPKYDSASFYDTYKYSTNINPNDITNSLASPDGISVWRMGKFINFLEDLGYSARDFKLYYFKLLILPLFMSCLVILSLSIVKDLKPNDKFSKTIILSFILIFIIYFMSNLFDALGSTSQLSPFLSKIITPLFILVVSFIYFQFSFFRKKWIIQ